MTEVAIAFLCGVPVGMLLTVAVLICSDHVR